MLTVIRNLGRSGGMDPNMVLFPDPDMLSNNSEKLQKEKILNGFKELFISIHFQKTIQTRTP